MTERRTLTLNENDIKQIIADRFNVDLNNVTIEVDHGDPQYPEDKVYVDVRMN